MALIPGLTRPTDDRMIAGVCSGIARKYGLDTNLVRLVVFLAIIPGGVSIWAYVAAWLLMPEDGADRSDAERLAEQAKSFAAEQKARREATPAGRPTEVFNPYVDDERR